MQAEHVGVQGYDMATISSTNALHHDGQIVTFEEKHRNMRPFEKVPREIWTPIFELAIQAEFEDYLKMNSNVPLRSMALIISHVDRFWRRIAMEESILWRIVAINWDSYWSQAMCLHFEHCIERARFPPILVCNSEQELQWKPPTNASYPNIWTEKMQPRVLDAETYHLLIIRPTVHVRDINESSHRHPKELILSSFGNPPDNYWFSDVLNPFSSIESLNLDIQYMDFIPTGSFHIFLPKLSKLVIQTERFIFRTLLHTFLTATLTELHIRHDDGLGLPQLDQHSFPMTITLPQLQILGITHPATGLLAGLKAPILHTLHVYKPHRGSTVTYFGPVELFPLIESVEFHDWGEGGVRALKVCQRLTTKLPRLRCLKFLRSFVDGEALLQLVTLRGAEGERPEENIRLEILEEITLNRTRGITRSECERLAVLVGKLNIYV